MRRRIKLEEYDFNVVHKSGHLNANADALSRLKTENVNIVTRSRERENQKQLHAHFSSPSSSNESVQDTANSINKALIPQSNPSRNYKPNLNTQADNHANNDLNVSSESVQTSEEIPRGNKPIILTDREKIPEILREYHGTPTGGHQGVTRTIKRIKQKYVWKNMYKDVKAHISSCDSCQKSKVTQKVKSPMKITTTSKKPFERVSLDIVGPINPPSDSGNHYILTFRDDLTKFVQAIPLPNQEASTIAEYYVRKIICVFGTPQYLLTDQGSNFVSDLFKRTCKLLKIQKIQTTPYHPQSNGSLERYHRSLNEYLRSYANKDPRNWDSWIDYAVFCYNTTPHSATNYSPYELLFDMKPEIPSSVTRAIDPVYNYDDYVIEVKARLQNGYAMARENLIKAKERSKLYYDRGTKETTFTIGDKVLLESKLKKNKKLTLKYEGPYEVIEIRSPEISLIQVGRKTKLVHNNLLKPYIA